MARSTTASDFRITGSEREEGILQRIGRRIVAARQDQARRAVNVYLLSLDDETLARLGYDRRELENTTPGGYPFI